MFANTYNTRGFTKFAELWSNEWTATVQTLHALLLLGESVTSLILYVKYQHLQRVYKELQMAIWGLSCMRLKYSAINGDTFFVLINYVIS